MDQELDICNMLGQKETWHNGRWFYILGRDIFLFVECWDFRIAWSKVYIYLSQRGNWSGLEEQIRDTLTLHKALRVYRVPVVDPACPQCQLMISLCLCCLVCVCFFNRDCAGPLMGVRSYCWILLDLRWTYLPPPKNNFTQFSELHTELKG